MPRQPYRGSSLSSLRRGLQASLANPGLVLAPLVLGFATILAVALSVLALALPLGFAFLKDAGSLWGKDPAAVAEAAQQALSYLAQAPLLVAVSCLVILALLTLLFVLASYLKAGLTGVLVASLRGAPEGAKTAAFRVEATRTFLAAARRHLTSFFWLLNLYGMAVTVFAFLFLVGLTGFAVRLFAVGVGAGPPGAEMALAVAAMIVGLPLLVVGIPASQVVTYAAAREIVERDVPVMEGVRRALARCGATVGRSAVLYLVLVAASLVVAAAFSVPRFFVGLAARFSLVLATPAVLGEVLFIFLQTVVLYFVQVVTAAAFTALWTEPAPQETAPAVATTMESPAPPAEGT